MTRVPAALRRKAKNIKLLLLDVDGVLTDGAIIIDDRGAESKQFNVRDGLGINLLQRAGIEVGFVTGRRSNVVRIRAKELGVRHLFQGVGDKAEVYRQVKQRLRLTDEQVAYVGDDLPDLPVLRQVALAITVPGAPRELTEAADYTTKIAGGQGAVREIAELLLAVQGRWRQSLNSFSK